MYEGYGVDVLMLGAHWRDSESVLRCILEGMEFLFEQNSAAYDMCIVLWPSPDSFVWSDEQRM